MLLETGDEGVRVSARWSWVARFARMRLGNVIKDANWAARWEDLEHVAVARYTILFVRADGTKCWFWTIWSRRARQIAEAVQAHGVQTSPLTRKEIRPFYWRG
jgi:hypothetical protein